MYFGKVAATRRRVYTVTVQRVICCRCGDNIFRGDAITKDSYNHAVCLKCRPVNLDRQIERGDPNQMIVPTAAPERKIRDNQNAAGLNTLGGRMYDARRAAGLTQDRLAGPEFTKSYISAIERNKVRPSLKALEILSRRLGRTMASLLTAPDLPAPRVSDEDVSDFRGFFRAYLKLGADAMHARNVLLEYEAGIAELEGAHPEFLAELPLDTRYPWESAPANNEE